MNFSLDRRCDTLSKATGKSIAAVLSRRVEAWRSGRAR
jgi:hypothetical protein